MSLAGAWKQLQWYSDSGQGSGDCSMRTDQQWQKPGGRRAYGEVLENGIDLVFFAAANRKFALKLDATILCVCVRACAIAKRDSIVAVAERNQLRRTPSPIQTRTAMRQIYPTKKSSSVMMTLAWQWNSIMRMMMVVMGKMPVLTKRMCSSRTKMVWLVTCSLCMDYQSSCCSVFQAVNCRLIAAPSWLPR